MSDTAAEHVHEVEREFPILLLGVCLCGEEFEQRRGKWHEPRKFEGMRRRFAWDEARRLEAAGRG